MCKIQGGSLSKHSFCHEIICLHSTLDSFKRAEHVKKRAMIQRKIGRVTWNDLASQMIEDGNSQIDRINEKGSRTSVKLKESL